MVITGLLLPPLPKSLYALDIISYQAAVRLVMAELRFGGSIWCNIDIALRNADVIYSQELESLGLSVVEWYILQFLYERDGQMASRLAEATGRPATSFTPILDKLQDKGFIERRAHPADRRAIRIYLTSKGKAIEQQVKASVERIETKFRSKFSDKEWQSYQYVIESLQSITP
jgi:DNA-binding MarR family transcriptional regulator